jgi:hypothetical protein
MAIGMKMAARIETSRRVTTITSGEASSSSGAVLSSVIGRKKNATAFTKPTSSSRPVPW